MITAADKPQIARLFQFIARGEHIASTCATQQSALATDNAMQRFFATQAKQERQHAFLFKHGAEWLSPKISYRPQAIKGLDAYERKLNSALEQNRLAESLIAQQIILEGLGEITLEKISTSMQTRGLGLKRIRETILKQERAHHHFGTRHIKTLLKSRNMNLIDMRQHCNEYLEIIQELLHEVQTLFEYFHQDTALYYQHVLNELPLKLRTKS